MVASHAKIQLKTLDFNASNNFAKYHSWKHLNPILESLKQMHDFKRHDQKLDPHIGADNDLKKRTRPERQ